MSSSDDALMVDYGSELSRGGLFIATERRLAPRTLLHLQFAPNKDAQLVSAFAQVTEVKSNGVSAQFLSLDAEAEQLIASALA